MVHSSKGSEVRNAIASISIRRCLTGRLGLGRVTLKVPPDGRVESSESSMIIVSATLVAGGMEWELIDCDWELIGCIKNNM